jgi:hypothetical protein
MALWKLTGLTCLTGLGISSAKRSSSLTSSNGDLTTGLTGLGISLVGEVVPAALKRDGGRRLAPPFALFYKNK